MARKTRVRRQRQGQRKSRQVSKPRKGGAIVGQGAFGCVYKPALRCRPDVRPAANNVSKLIYSRMRNKEMGPPILPEINAAQEYFVYPYADCPFNSSIQTNYSESCSVVDKTKGERHLLLMKYGGIEPDNWIYEPQDYYDFFVEYGKTFTGIRKLHEGGYIHLDIKPSNMLLKRSRLENRFYLRMIDFGLSRNVDEMMREYYDEQQPLMNSGHVYDYHPPLIQLFSVKRMKFINPETRELYDNKPAWFGNLKNIYDNWGNVITNKNKQTTARVSIPEVFHYSKFNERLFGGGPNRGYYDLALDALQSRERTANFFKNVDYYSLGLTLLEFIYLFFGITMGLSVNPDGTVDETKCRPIIYNEMGRDVWSDEIKEKYRNYEELRWPPGVLEWFREFVEGGASFLQGVYEFVNLLMLNLYSADPLDEEDLESMYIENVLGPLERSIFINGEKEQGLRPEFTGYLLHARPTYSYQFLKRLLTPNNRNRTRRRQ